MTQERKRIKPVSGDHHTLLVRVYAHPRTGALPSLRTVRDEILSNLQSVWRDLPASVCEARNIRVTITNATVSGPDRYDVDMVLYEGRDGD